MKGDGFEADKQRWLNQVAADPEMTAAGLRAAIMICFYMNRQERRAWASRDRMAQDFDLDRSGIGEGLRVLEERGHLDVHRKGGRQGNDYRWRFSEVVIVSEPARWANRSGRKPSTAETDVCGRKPSTAKRERRGGRFVRSAVDDSAFCGGESSSETTENHREELSRPGGAPPGPGRVPESNTSDSFIERPRSSSRSRTPSPVPAGRKPAEPEAQDAAFEATFAAITKTWGSDFDEPKSRRAVRAVLRFATVEEVCQHVREAVGDDDLPGCLSTMRRPRRTAA